MVFAISMLTLFLPIVTRRYFLVIQSIAITLWLIASLSIQPTFPASSYEVLLQELSFYFLPTWVVGSLIALYLLLKSNCINTKAEKDKETTMK